MGKTKEVSTSLRSLLKERGVEVSYKIGAGATKTVYKGRYHLQGDTFEDVAIKVISKEFLLSQQARDAFLKEANILKEVEHPNVEKLVDAFKTDNHVVLVTEFIDGYSLATYAEYYSERRKKHIPWEIAAIVTKKIAEGLAAIHRAGFVHRDLSPSNVMLEKKKSFDDGVKLIDLGLAKRWGEDGGVSSIFRIEGTMPFAAPELRTDASMVDERADSFSLATIFYYLLTYSYPFGPLDDYYERAQRRALIPISGYRKDLPPAIFNEISNLIWDNLSPVPQDRDTADEVAEKLDRLLSTHLTKIVNLYNQEVISFLYIPEIKEEAELEDEYRRDELDSSTGTIKEEISPRKKKKGSTVKMHIPVKLHTQKRVGTVLVLALLGVLLAAAITVALPGKKGNSSQKEKISFEPIAPTTAAPSSTAQSAPASTTKEHSFKKKPQKRPESVPHPSQTAHPSREPSPLSYKAQTTTPQATPSLFGPAVKKVILRNGTMELVLSPTGKVLSQKVTLTGKKFIFIVKK